MARVFFLFLLLLLAACDQAPQGSADVENMSIDIVDVNATDENAVDMNASAENLVVDENAVGNDASLLPTTGPNPVDVEAGEGAFIEPGDMEIDNWHRIEFVVAPEDESGAGSALAKEAEGKPLTTPQQVFISPSMRVTLVEDPSFRIQPMGDSLKRLGLDKAATWQWNVKPLTDGDRELVAKVEVLKAGPDGGFETLDEYTRRVNVSVRVGTWQGFLNALQNASSLGDALGTLFRSWEKTLLALAGLLGAAFVVARVVRNRGAK